MKRKNKKLKIKKATQLLNKMAPKGEKLAYINNREAELLKRMGGAGKNINETGIKSYYYDEVGQTMGGTGFQDTSHLTGGSGDGGGGGAPTQTQTDQSKKDTGARGFLDTTTTALNLIGKTAFDVSGLGLAVKAAKTFGPKVREVLTPQTTKKTTDARLSGSFTTTYAKKPQPTTTTYTGGDSEPIIKKPIEAITKVMPTETLTAKKFFPFRAYRNGGVPSGPPPKRGPNPQVPPVKLRNGGVKTNSKKSVSMRGIGKAIRGTKFSGVY
jgi:hypothetical protein